MLLCLVKFLFFDFYDNYLTKLEEILLVTSLCTQLTYDMSPLREMFNSKESKLHLTTFSNFEIKSNRGSLYYSLFSL